MNPMIKIKETSNIQATDNFLRQCQVANFWRQRGFTFKDIASFMGKSESTARRAYYGIHHHKRPGDNYTQIRVGSSVVIRP